MAIIDLSHTMRHGTKTYKGIPAPHVCDFLNREKSKEIYAEGTSFQMDTIELVGNSGTYMDSPFHRYKDGKDLSELALAATVDLPAITVRVTASGSWMAIDVEHFEGLDVKGKAVLIATGWDQHFDTETYQSNHPYLTEAAATYLRDSGAALVGIDSHNIDDIRGNTRPAHTVLLGAEIPIVEHMANVTALPDSGFRFFAAPVKFAGIGTFPTRAYAIT